MAMQPAGSSEPACIHVRGTVDLVGPCRKEGVSSKGVSSKGISSDLQRTVLLHDASRASPRTRGTTMSGGLCPGHRLRLPAHCCTTVLGEVKNKNLPCTTEQQDWGYGDGSPEDWVSSGGRSRNRVDVEEGEAMVGRSVRPRQPSRSTGTLSP